MYQASVPVFRHYLSRVSDIVAEITSASIEQSAGISQVGDAVTQMDQVTQQNAALVEESAAAAANLKSQAQQLVDAVAVFKLAQDTAPGQAVAMPAAKHPASTASPLYGGPERRGPQRATNVARLPAQPRAAHKPGADVAAAKTGTDDWESF